MGTTKGSQTNPHPLSPIVQTIHEKRQGPVCVQCLTAPAFETRRKAVRTAALSIERTKGYAQTRNIYSQIR